jgi:hypothetical protein
VTFATRQRHDLPRTLIAGWLQRGRGRLTVSVVLILPRAACSLLSPDWDFILTKFFFFQKVVSSRFPGTEIVTDDRVPAADRFIVSLVPKLSPTTGSLRLTVSSFLTVIGTEFFTDDRVPVAIYS